MSNITVQPTAIFVLPKYGERDFPEDAQHENGIYQNKCCVCENTFIGHKRRVVCKVCMAKQPRGVSDFARIFYSTPS